MNSYGCVYVSLENSTKEKNKSSRHQNSVVINSEKFLKVGLKGKQRELHRPKGHQQLSLGTVNLNQTQLEEWILQGLGTQCRLLVDFALPAREPLAMMSSVNQLQMQMDCPKCAHAQGITLHTMHKGYLLG